MPTGATRRARLSRWMGLDRNPLRRKSDRVEAVLRLVLLTAFVPLAVLAAASTGHWVHVAGIRDQGAAPAQKQVTAVLLQAAPAVQPLPGQAGLWVPARWTAGGKTHVGLVPAAPGTLAGSRVRIRLDRAGRVEPAPLTSNQLTSRVVVAVAVAPLVVALGLWLAWRAVQWFLDRRRLTAWAAGWSEVGPLWSQRR